MTDTPIRHPVLRKLVSRARLPEGTADNGQALILALIVVLLLSLLPTAVLTSLDQEMPYGTATVNYEGALAAAEAGVQEYANLLDQYPGYYNNLAWPGGATTSNDPKLLGGSNAALGGWAQVAGTNPPEYFSYYPDTSQLQATASSSDPLAGDVLLVVTGRAGSGGTAQYKRIEAAFSVSGVITDVYFSNYEQPGAADADQYLNVFPAGCTAGQGGCTALGSTVSHGLDEIDVDTGCATTSNCFSPQEPMATALCQVDADEPNAYIDWYSQYVSPLYPPPDYPFHDLGKVASAAYSLTNPFYGPWYSVFADPADSAYDFGAYESNNGGDTSACQTNYYIGGDTFNGPVFSQDELTTCQNPAFTGAPSLETSISATFPFPAEQTAGGIVSWPGQQTGALHNGTYSSYPYGYDHDPWDECGGGTCPGNASNCPQFSDPNAPHFGIQQSLPSENTNLISEIKAGTIKGCLYTGPTSIRFSYNTSSGATTMLVWSPLTKDTYGGAAQCGNVDTTGKGPGDLCGGVASALSACAVNSSGVPTNTQVSAGAGPTVQTAPADYAQVPVTGPLVVAVQNLPSTAIDLNNAWSSLPAAEASSTYVGATNCIDPWTSPDSGLASLSTASCTEGDAIVAGASGEPITISASNDVVLSRSLVDGCAVNPSGTYQTNLNSCSKSTDVMGLLALNDVWLARPYVNGPAPACGDDNDMTVASIAWSDMVPNCTIGSPIIDAASSALQGFFEVEFWKEGKSNGTLYFNGSDAVNNAGQYGTFSGSTLDTGYYLALNYDSRLKYDPPPAYFQATNAVWNVVGWISCGNSTPNPFTPNYPNTAQTGASNPANPTYCTGLQPNSYAL